METIISKLNINQPICQSSEDDNILSYMKDENLSIDFILEYQNGNVWGVFYDEDGNLAYQTNDGVEDIINEGSVMLSEGEDVIFDESDDDCIRYPYKHAYLINDNGIIEKLDLEENSAYDGSGLRYYQGEKGALVIEEEEDGTENSKKSGFYLTSYFGSFCEQYSEMIKGPINNVIDSLLCSLGSIRENIKHDIYKMIDNNETNHLDRIVYINSELRENGFMTMDFCPEYTDDCIDIEDIYTRERIYEIENNVEYFGTDSEGYDEWRTKNESEIYDQYIELIDNITRYLEEVDGKYYTDYSTR